MRRLQFARKYKDWSLEKWRTVLWSEECTFYIIEGEPSKTFHHLGLYSDTYNTQKITTYPPTMTVWGCFSYYGVGNLVIFPKDSTLNEDMYFELVNDHLEESFEKTCDEIFQQDGTSCHTARDVIQWLDDCGIERINDWLDNSPDISPIENLWAIINGKLRSRDISTLPKLEMEL